MALPKHRHTKSRRNMRRAHHAVKQVTVSSCPKCKESVLSHIACKSCGFYNGKEVVNVMSKLDKKEKKTKEKKLNESSK